jgi:hypothetical protein
MPPSADPDDLQQIQQATAVLTAFAAAMAEWERDCLAQERHLPVERLDRNEVHERHEAQRATCQAIFDRHCNNRPRPYSRPESPQFRDPPEYAAEQFCIERAEFDKSRRIHAYTTDGPHGRFRFTLVKKKDGWRVDQREVWDGKTWSSTGL